MKRLLLLFLFLVTLPAFAQTTGDVFLASGSSITCNVGSAEKGDLSTPCVVTVHNNTGSTFQFLRWYFIEHATTGPWSNTRQYSQNMFVTYAGKCWEATGGGNVGQQPDISPSIWTNITTTYPNGCKNTTMQADGDAVVRTWGDNCETLANQQNGGDYHIPYNYPLANAATCTINAYLKPTVAGASTGHVYIKAADGTTLDTITLNGTGTAVAWNKTATLPAGITKTGAHTYSDSSTWLPTGKPAGCTGLLITNGDTLQSRINLAAPGDVLCVQAGTTFTKTGGTKVTIPNNGNTGPNYVTIITANYASLPAEGNRIGPSDLPNLATISSTDTTMAIEIQAGAAYWRFKGLKIDNGPSAVYALVYTYPYNSNATSAALEANHIVFDQVYFYQHSDTGAGGIDIGDGAYMAVTNSYFDIDNTGETQCMSGTNGPGPIKILNNYCRIPSEGLLFGGGDSTILGGNPSDIEVRNNYFTKSWTWNKWCVGPSNPCPGGATWDGKSRTVKNNFEFKKAIRALVTGNVFGPGWADGQTASVLMEPANQSGSDIGATVRDVTYDSNIIDGAAIAFASVATSYAFFSQGSKHIVFTDTLMKNVGGAAYGTPTATNAYCFQVSGGTPGGGKFYLQPNYFAGEDYAFTHNSCIGDNIDGMFVYDATGQTFPQINGSAWKDNLNTHGTYGMWFNGPESTNISTVWLNYDVAKGGFVGGNSGNYDANFLFVANSSAARFANYSFQDYRLCSGAGTPDASCVGASPFHNTASDGTDFGADIAAVNTATSCAISGLCGTGGGGGTGGSGTSSIKVCRPTN